MADNDGRINTMTLIDGNSRPPDAPRRDEPSASARDRDAWYVVYSKPRKEASAELHLRLRGIAVFYPQLVLPDYVRSARRCVPLFPNYLFVKITLLARFSDVVWSPGVKGFVGPNGVPAPIDEEVVAFLQRHTGPDGRLRARPDLRPGQEVEIIDGPFTGLMGIIQRPPDAKGRIKVLMRLLNRQPVRVEVPVRFVKSGWVA
jgi:transcriptional antiterminator RfaH